MTHPGGKVCCLSRVFHRPTCVTGRFGLFNRTAWRRRSPFKEIVFVTTSFDQSDKQPVADLHSRFLELLPRLQLHGRIFFRALTPEKKEEAIAEGWGGRGLASRCRHTSGIADSAPRTTEPLPSAWS
jgi:hypothetical protein